MATNDGGPECLERYWDAAVRGHPPPPVDLDPALADAVRRLHAGDDSPAPDPAFLARLEEDLMQHTRTVSPQRGNAAVFGAPLGSNAQPRAPFGHASAGASSRLRSPFSWLASAALVLLTLAIAIFASRLDPSSHEDDPSAVTGAQGAPVEVSPGASPTTAECRVAPAPLGRTPFEGPPPANDALPLAPGPYEGQPVGTDRPLPIDGTPADPHAVAGVTATVRELVACVNANDGARLAALFTDDYWRRLDSVEFGLGAEPDFARAGSLLPLVGGPPGPVPSPAVEDLRLLPDGRIAAILRPTWYQGEPPWFDYYVFARVSDRWLVDEAVGARPRTVVPVDVVVGEDGFEPPEIRVDGAQDVRLTIRNEGVAAHSLVIPDLGVRMEVQPGQSKTEQILEVELEEGAQRFFSDLPNDREAGLVGTLIVGGSPTATPPPVTVTPNDEPAYTVPLASATIEARPPGSFDPTSLAILADRDVPVTLRNTEPSAATFTIDQLGIDVALAPGASREIIINAAAGVYAFSSTLPGHPQAGMYGTLFVIDEATQTPT